MPRVQEEWRPVLGFEGMYEVSNLGRIRSLDRVVVTTGSECRPSYRRTVKGRLISQHMGWGGYPFVQLNRAGRGTSHSVHSLVAAAFHGPRPDGHEVHHINGIKADNHASNLTYVTPSENTQRALDDGLMPYGERSYNARLTADEVRNIRASKGTISKRSLAKKYGVHPSTIGGIWARREWKHVE